MERIWTTDLPHHAGQRVRLAGWVHRLRRLSNVSFLILRDAKGLAQVVIEDAALAEQLDGLYHESVVAVEGLAVTSAQAPGGVEIHAPTIEIVSPAANPPPLDLFRPVLRAQLPTILDHAALTLRHPRQRALFRLAAASVAGFRATLNALDFVEIQTPKIVATATESGANVFQIDYFGRPAYLAQSPQLYKQIMVGVFERVFEVGPVFRAEPHDTPRHLDVPGASAATLAERLHLALVLRRERLPLSSRLLFHDDILSRGPTPYYECPSIRGNPTDILQAEALQRHRK